MPEPPSIGDPTPGVPGLLVLLSGSGRTLVNLAQAIAQAHLRARIAGVIASRVCAGCDRARELGIQPLVLPGVIPGNDLAQAAGSAGASLIVLAGYLQRVDVPANFAGRVVNIHPALLPSFGGKGMYGDHVHRAVLSAGCKVSGCTVHLVNAEYDRGPIVAQRACEVLDNDTPASLAARVFALECEAYPAAISLLLSGCARVVGQRVLAGAPA